jgi:hypothetical protein
MGCINQPCKPFEDHVVEKRKKRTKNDEITLKSAEIEEIGRE